MRSSDVYGGLFFIPSYKIAHVEVFNHQGSIGKDGADIIDDVLAAGHLDLVLRTLVYVEINIVIDSYRLEWSWISGFRDKLSIRPETVEGIFFPARGEKGKDQNNNGKAN